MRSIVAIGLLLCSSSVMAQTPYHRQTVPHRQWDPIPPLGNNLPYSYARRYNRPSYMAGKLAHIIEPTSQEAMSWHDHVQRGSYRRKAGRIVDLYYHPKPWEVLTVGPRDASEGP